MSKKQNQGLPAPVTAENNVKSAPKAGITCILWECGPLARKSDPQDPARRRLGGLVHQIGSSGDFHPTFKSFDRSQVRNEDFLCHVDRDVQSRVTLERPQNEKYNLSTAADIL